MLVHLRKIKFPAASGYQRVLSYQGRTAAFLNALLTFRGEGKLYQLAHVTLLECVGNPIPHGPKGISYVESPPMEQEDIVVWIRNIEGAVHLVPLEPNQRWVVNSRIDYHIWNEMNDGL